MLAIYAQMGTLRLKKTAIQYGLRNQSHTVYG